MTRENYQKGSTASMVRDLEQIVMRFCSDHSEWRQRPSFEDERAHSASVGETWVVEIDGAVEVGSNRRAMEAELCGDNQTRDMLLTAMKGRSFPDMPPQRCQVAATEIPDSFVQSSNGLPGYSAAVSASVREGGGAILGPYRNRR